jgi:hypothetical protein
LHAEDPAPGAAVQQTTAIQAGLDGSRVSLATMLREWGRIAASGSAARRCTGAIDANGYPPIGEQVKRE